MTRSVQERESLREMLQAGGAHREQAKELIVTLKAESAAFLKAHFAQPLEQPCVVVSSGRLYPVDSKFWGCWCAACANEFCATLSNPASRWQVQRVRPIDGNPGRIYQRCQRCFCWLDIPKIPYHVGEYNRLRPSELALIDAEEIWLAGRIGAEHQGITWLGVVESWKNAKGL